MNGSLANNLGTHSPEAVNRPLTAVLTETGPQEPFIWILLSHQMTRGIFFYINSALEKALPFVITDGFLTIQTMIRMVNSFLYS